MHSKENVRKLQRCLPGFNPKRSISSRLCKRINSKLVSIRRNCLQTYGFSVSFNYLHHNTCWQNVDYKIFLSKSNELVIWNRRINIPHTLFFKEIKHFNRITFCTKENILRMTAKNLDENYCVYLQLLETNLLFEWPWSEIDIKIIETIHVK